MISIPFVGLIAGIVLIIFSSHKYASSFKDGRAHRRASSDPEVSPRGRRACKNIAEKSYFSASLAIVLLTVGIAVTFVSSLVLATR